jgi:hypothetical protein
MSRRALLLPAALLLGCTFVAAARAAFGIAVAPATVTASPVTLSGVDQVSSFTATITVSGAANTGWNITAWAPLPASGANTLAALVVPSQPTLGVCSGGGCNLPTPLGLTWPAAVGTTAGTATKIYNADVSTGKGTNTVTVTFNIPVPARALPGSYTTTLTIIGSNSGP